MSQRIYQGVLGEGYVLHWYEIKSVLGQGAFGVTYLAQDQNLDRPVAIKEYFPKDFASRDEGKTVHPTTGEHREVYSWGLDRFIKEARVLAQFSHPNIVRVYTVFEQNGTAYMAMEYERGRDLAAYYDQDEYIGEQQLLDIFLPILDGLKGVHEAGFIHRDIKPANIYLRENGTPVLIDFGAARKTRGVSSSALTSLVTYGYAPFEQHNEGDEEQGPWTDIYALGACLYLAVTGKLPETALMRGAALLGGKRDPYVPVSFGGYEGYSKAFLLAIDHALRFHGKDRPRDVEAWSAMLKGEVEPAELPADLYAPLQDTDTGTVLRPVTANRGTGKETPKTPEKAIKDNQVDKNKDVPVHGKEADEKGKAKGGPEKSQARPAKSKSTAARTKAPGSGGSRWMLRTYFSVLGGLFLALVFFIFHAVYQGISEEELAQEIYVEGLFMNANAAVEAYNYFEPGGENAMYYLDEILYLDPDHEEASQLRQDILDAYVDAVRGALREDNLDDARAYYEELAAGVPYFSGLEALAGEIETWGVKSEKIKELLAAAEAHEKASRISEPPGENALEKYREVLRLDPENAQAYVWVDRYSGQLYDYADAHIEAQQFEEARRYMGELAQFEEMGYAMTLLRARLAKAMLRNP